MPTLAVYTNIPRDTIPNDFTKKATSLIAKQLDKPESVVTVRIHPDQIMTLGGSNDPCGSIELYSIDNLSPDKNPGYTEAIGKLIEDELKIPEKRFFITFVSQQGSDVGHCGKTFQRK